MRKAKIVATLGPATASGVMIEKLLRTGVNVFRLNFSHGDHKFHGSLIKKIRLAVKKTGIPAAILQDLQGPKIRVCRLKEPVEVKKGQEIIITGPNNPVAGVLSFGIDVEGLYRHVKKGSRIQINDGMVNLLVRRVDSEAGHIICSAANSGLIEPRKGVNLPGIKLPIDSFTKKDLKDLKFGLKNKADLVALSFVRCAEDMIKLKRKITGPYKPLLIAKIEKPEALPRISKILDACDGIMVARGDLAVEAGYKAVPMAQKKMTALANKKGKISIVATQMLESMIKNPFPQRAEITDIYNAVLDGADCLMLSGETSIGKYPVKAVTVMKEIIKQAEKEKAPAGMPHFIKSPHETESVLSYAAAAAAEALKDDAIAVTAYEEKDIAYISDYRPSAVIIALVCDPQKAARFSIYNGVYPVCINNKMNKAAAEKAVTAKFKKIKKIIFIDLKNKTMAL